MSVWNEVGDRVFVRRYSRWADEPFDQNIGAVLGQRGLVVIDTRASHRLADELRDDIRALTRQPLVAVVNTHHHWDHSFGNARFLPRPIWGHARCAERVRDEGDSMRARVTSQAPEFADELAEVVLAAPDQLFTDTATIDLGDRQLQMAYLGRGHTDNDIVIEVAEVGVLFAGDLLENDAPPGYGDAYPRAWAATVTERLLPLVRDAVVPGHGSVGDRAFVTTQAADLAAMAELGALLAAGQLDDDEAIRRAPFPEDTARTALQRALAEMEAG
ncbi:MAG TPA: MBL fold metallo-hydrolase [Candidatus Limnocylindria bacterium]|jgi:glyoxylase-like metal-dependent hydrolase (beta-lactamase superfamily II)